MRRGFLLGGNMAWIQHVGITCENLERSEEFYVKYLGFKKIRKFIVPEEEIKRIFGIDSPANVSVLKAENQEIELFYYENNKNKFDMGKISHINLMVSDREAVYRKIISDGYQGILIDRAGGRKTYFVKDPEDNLIELRQPH
jgi:catechol 2,3-dioxygenase-like lactoylglutathione lyase family enzyme